MRRQRDRVEHYIAVRRTRDDVATGGGRRTFQSRLLHRADDLWQCRHRSIIGREEIFARSKLIPAQAIRRARDGHDTNFGLNASVFTTCGPCLQNCTRLPRTVGKNGVRADATIASAAQTVRIGREGRTRGPAELLDRTSSRKGEPRHLRSRRLDQGRPRTMNADARPYCTWG